MQVRFLELLIAIWKWETIYDSLLVFQDNPEIQTFLSTHPLNVGDLFLIF